MQIQLLSNQVTTQTNSKGKPMQVLEVAYKNLTFQGKVESKKLFDFGVQADSFKVLAAASPTTTFEVEVVKNNAGYNDWVKVTRADVTSATAQATSSGPSRAGTSPASAAPKGNWETPEERAKKQVYIIRQSSLNVAVAALAVGAKKPLDAGEIIGLAKQLEAFVLDTGADVSEVVKQDIESMDEDIPF